MAFNLGRHLFGFVNTLCMIQNGKYKEASVEMLESRWARQVGIRAERLSQQILTGDWQ